MTNNVVSRDEIIEMAHQASKLWIKEYPAPADCANPVPKRYLEIFAKLVALRYEKKIADLENIICQRHWDVLQEREACIVDIQMHMPRSGRDTLEYKMAMRMIERIRARGETTLRGEA